MLFDLTIMSITPNQTKEKISEYPSQARLARSQIFAKAICLPKNAMRRTHLARTANGTTAFAV